MKKKKITIKRIDASRYVNNKIKTLDVKGIKELAKKLKKIIQEEQNYYGGIQTAS